MDHFTILKPTSCDVRQLPLDALEAFVLSQLDGQLTLEEIAQIASLDLVETARLARRLVELGAAEASNATHATSAHASIDRKKGAKTAVSEVQTTRAFSRADPRAERVSLQPARAAQAGQTPAPSQNQKRRTSRTDARAEKMSVRPEARKNSLRPNTAKTQRPPAEPRRPTRKSLRTQRVAAPLAAAPDERCELDDETQATILALDKKLAKIDHYTALSIERDADKKAIKRAYFGFVSKFHPDRFFGKKVGAFGARIDRIFHRLTEAHDTLSNPALRATYDATLPRAPSPPPPPPPTPTTTAAPRKASKAMRLSSRRVQASRKKTSTAIVAAEKAKTPAPTPAVPQRSEGRLRELHQAAREIKIQARVELCLQAAEEALRADDVIGAANNYRLALEHREDAHIRSKLEMVDREAKTLRFTRSVTQGRIAERDQRWSDAATHFGRANEVRPTADIADRAAYAMRMSNGDLERAATLAEQAVSMEANNAAYRTTLGEIYLALNRLDDADEETDKALDIAPSDTRAKRLAAAVTKMRKSSKE